MRGGAPDAGGETEVAAIGEGDGFLVTAERHDGKDGAEGFLPHQAHGRVEIGDEGGSVKIGAEISEQ